MSLRSTAPEDVELMELQVDYGDRWRIWRGMSEHSVPGGWHARLIIPSGDLRSLRADTAHGLRRAMRQAEAER